MRKNSPSLAVALNCGMGIQFFECGGERIGKTPDRPRLEFLVLRLKVEVMPAASKVFRSFEFPLDERLLDDHLGRYIRQLTSLPCLHLLPHRLKVPLHPVNANRESSNNPSALW